MRHNSDNTSNFQLSTFNFQLPLADLILKYFPTLTDVQQRQIALLDALYRQWNAKINLVSRKDIDNLYEHHVLHSLAIARHITFRPGTRVLDLGTGGGFPGIPLAIMFPDVEFKLIDGTGKKIVAVRDIVDKTGLTNCRAEQVRGEDERERFDFVVSRAVMPLADIERMVRKNITPTQRNSMPNGIIVLKGGDVSAEIRPFRHVAEVSDIHSWFGGEWFKDKHVVYLPMKTGS